MWRSPKYLKLVASLPCLIQTPVCRGRDDTVVPVHSDQMEDGKGKGLKAHDMMTAPGCFECHQWIHDIRNRKERDWYMDRGIKRTIRMLCDMGKLGIL